MKDLSNLWWWIKIELMQKGLLSLVFLSKSKEKDMIFSLIFEEIWSLQNS